MIDPLFDPVLTDDQLKTVGMISFNWAMVEREITDILRDFYSLTDEQDAIELVAVLDLDKKLSLLKKKIGRGPKPKHYDYADWERSTELLKALQKSASDFRDGRNHVIHGSAVRFFGKVREPAIWSSKKRTLLELSELPKILDQSTYLTHLMAHLSSALYGSALAIPLPEKPA